MMSVTFKFNLHVEQLFFYGGGEGWRALQTSTVGFDLRTCLLKDLEDADLACSLQGVGQG